MLPLAVTEALIIIIIIAITIIHILIHSVIIIITISIAGVLDVTVSSNRAVDVPLCQPFGGFGCCRGRCGAALATATATASVPVCC